MAFIGIDPSLRRPGVAVVRDDGSCLFARSVSVGRHLRGGERLKFIYDAADTLLKGTGLTYQRAAMEGPSLNSTHREFDLGEGSGVFKILIYSFANEPYVVPPTSLKKFATGFSTADKAQVLHAVKIYYGVDLGDDDDAADALVLAKVAWAVSNREQLTRRHEVQVISSLTAPKKIKPRAKLNRSENI